ncbi:signal transduction histidine kinase [Lipingzhangella halophila]|uniref:histidine kinase n=1 Tax=Lipingzhangella halophila TaxID=1783352 RepID=A0A7W7RJW2_9ACTN|nr:histidine kinase [Lipingzhangella halophila]MBB4933276.1 signal transduction histidine kinase [Lipingzhangella halophila]
MRNHPRVADGAVAGAVFLYSLPIQVAYAPEHPPFVGVVLIAGLCAPYVFRRDRPLATFAVMALTAFAQWLLGVMLLPATFMLFFGLYNAAARCGRWVSAAVAAIVEIGVVLAVLEWGADPIMELFTGTALVVSVWIWGYTIGTRRAYLASLEERAVRLERERDNQAQIAAAAERARIARDIHDVVSHSLSVMVVQADGAAYSLRGQPDRAERALATISDTGRTALTEMRRMLGVLRDGEPEHDSYAPQPGIAQLDQLVAGVRRSGLPVHLTVEGVPRDLPAGMELAVYRIVQEALTNTRKHAGPNVSRVRVRLRYGQDVLEIRIRDDGRGAAVVHSGSGAEGGHGLVGMRERAAAYGGSIRTGPRAGGGFEIAASLPLEAE